jgi:hypothetical protein
LIAPGCRFWARHIASRMAPRFKLTTHYPLLITRPSPNPEAGCTLCTCSRENCRKYPASDSHTSANGYSWHAGSRSAAWRWASWQIFCGRALPKRSVLRRNLECARRLARKSVAAAKTCWKEMGSRREYSRWTSESNGQGRKANGRCKSKAEDNDNWLVISQCVIQWNTIKRGKKHSTLRATRPLLC